MRTVIKLTSPLRLMPGKCAGHDPVDWSRDPRDHERTVKGREHSMQKARRHRGQVTVGFVSRWRIARAISGECAKAVGELALRHSEQVPWTPPICLSA